MSARRGGSTARGLRGSSWRGEGGRGAKDGRLELSDPRMSQELFLTSLSSVRLQSPCSSLRSSSLAHGRLEDNDDSGGKGGEEEVTIGKGFDYKSEDEHAEPVPKIDGEKER